MVPRQSRWVGTATPVASVHALELAAHLLQGLLQVGIRHLAEIKGGRTNHATIADRRRSFHFLHRSRRSLAWLSLDAGDNDPVRFWRHIVAALERFSPGIARRIGPMLGPPAPSSFDGMVGALINELVSQPAEAEIVLALDDYHVIDSPAVHGSVAFLLEHLPPRVRLVLSARADPPSFQVHVRRPCRLSTVKYCSRLSSSNVTVSDPNGVLRCAPCS